MRYALCLVLITSLVGCGSCGSDEPEEEESTRPPQVEEVEPEPEPEPDPCIATDAELAEWNEDAPVATDALPTSAGGEPLGETPILHVGEVVHLDDEALGTVEEAVAALEEAELPADQPIALALRATDPVTRVAPIIHAFEDRTFALVVLETDRETECRLLRQITFGLKTDEDHGWVTFPTTRPVSDLLIALGGADVPRRVQLLGE